MIYLRVLYLKLWAFQHSVDLDWTFGLGIAVLRTNRRGLQQASSVGLRQGTFGQFRRQLNFVLMHAERAITLAEQTMSGH